MVNTSCVYFALIIANTAPKHKHPASGANRLFAPLLSSFLNFEKFRKLLD